MVEQGGFQQRNHEAPTPHQPREKSRLRDVINFVRVSPMQQLLVAINLTTAAVSGMSALERASDGNYSAAVGLVAVSLLNLAVLEFNESAAVGKFFEYNKIKESLERHGWDERIIKPKSHTWCQRNAARVAAIDCGYKTEIDDYYKAEGYRWYHLLPYTKSSKSK